MLQTEPNKLKIKSYISELKYAFREEDLGNLKQAWQSIATVMCAATRWHQSTRWPAAWYQWQWGEYRCPLAHLWNWGRLVFLKFIWQNSLQIYTNWQSGIYVDCLEVYWTTEGSGMRSGLKDQSKLQYPARPKTEHLTVDLYLIF